MCIGGFMSVVDKFNSHVIDEDLLGYLLIFSGCYL